jgi:hypothetical protein
MKKQISQRIFNRFLHNQLVLPKYNVNATGEWIRNESGLPWLPLSMEIPAQTILSEIQNIKHLLTAHRDDYAEHSGWSSFCLHGKAYNATREDEYYNDDRPYMWTPEAVELMPQSIDFFKQQWPAKNFDRLRVMRLAPGGWISVHRDVSTRSLWPINIAITQPEECVFLMERHGPIPFKSGTAFFLDVSNLHTVFNNSDQDRWHIIVHQQFTQEFDNLVANSYNKLYNNLNETMHHTNT